jgi:hypothetical protein
MAFDDRDPLDVALDIKRAFAKTVASREKQSFLNVGYALGVVIWWVVVFASFAIAGAGWPLGAIVASVVCWLWPVIRLIDLGKSLPR